MSNLNQFIMKKLFTLFTAMVTFVAVNAQSLDYELMGFLDPVTQDFSEEMHINMTDTLIIYPYIVNNGPEELANGDSLLFNIAVAGFDLGYVGWGTSELAQEELLGVSTGWVAQIGLFTAAQMDQYAGYFGNDFEVCVTLSTKNATDTDPSNNNKCVHVYRGATDIEEVAEGEVNVYPNPATTVINIDNAEGAQISVYDLSGRMVSNVNSASANQTIDASNLAKGMYIVRIANGNNVITKKVNVVR